jgi:hypothetical protein
MYAKKLQATQLSKALTILWQLRSNSRGFQRHWWEDSGWVRWGWLREEDGRYWEVETDPAFALSVIWDIPRCDGVWKPLKKTHTWSGGTGVRTRDLPNVKWRGRRLATVLGEATEIWRTIYFILSDCVQFGRIFAKWILVVILRKRNNDWILFWFFLSSYLVFFISGKPNLSLEKKYVEGRRRLFRAEIAQH